MNKITEMDNIAKAVKYIVGYEVKFCGREISREHTESKHMFYRQCFIKGISGTLSSRYTASKSRYTAINGRTIYVKKCKVDANVMRNWMRFREYYKNNEEKETKSS